MPPAETVQAPPHDAPAGPAYYDLPMLKPPVWKWQIATYFFLGGLSAGAFILDRMAERFGGDNFAEVRRLGTCTALAALAPCPLLLIDDLGDKSRFHHMLRVWKPSSPMNLGTWVLTAIAPVAAAAAGRELLRERAARSRGLNVVAGAVGVVADVAGVPLAFLLATYTGVLLTNNATPVWAQNKWMSPMFAIGGLSTGASAISLAMALRHRRGGEAPAEKALKHFSTAAHVAELCAFSGYLLSLKPVVRRPFTTGTMKRHTRFTFGALAVAEVLKRVPVKGRLGKSLRVAGHVASLASAFSMRWSVVYGAHESGKDAEAARAFGWEAAVYNDLEDFTTPPWVAERTSSSQ